MKTATDTLDIGRTVEKTTVTRVIPADPLTGERKTPDFFEYIEKLLPAEWQRHPKHTLYIYRRHGDSGSGTPLEKLFGFFPLPNQDPVPLNDREELETVIAQKYGGGTYRLVLKKGSERITEGRITIDGPPKNTRPGILDTVSDENPSSPGANGSNSSDASTDVAKTAMHIVANQDAEAMRIGMSALHNAADVVQRFSTQIGAPPAAAGPMDELTRQFMHAMIQKMMNPPDPFEMLKTVMSLVNANGNPMVEKIINGALDRFMNAPAVVPGGAPVSTGAALVAQLPQIASYVSEAVREWRVGSEAQLQTAQVMASSGRPPALPAAPGTVQPPAPGPPITQATQLNPAPTAAPIAEAQVMPAGTPSLEFIESKIVEILKKQISADDAADEVLAFLDLMAPTMVDQLAACTEAQLVQLFQARPVLRQYHDLARLQEFVRSFLKFANDNGPATGVIDTSKPN